ncbi:alpha/beta fold hydrolase [Falsiroseomonas sp. HW251]|uniref:alpha/beta fold hydrolase n=1 Tax=Falsiroseomonas sp. HW251 TaxID=3390998 RepID=UPI003D31AF84
MHGIGHLLRIVFCGAALLGAACSPVVIPGGPASIAPDLVGDAIVAPDGARLPLRRFAPDGPPRAVILALHGFNDHSGNFLTDSLPALHEAGLLVYAYDQRGFGRAPNRGYWAGTETMAADAVAAAQVIRRRHPGLPLYLLGESMGGAVAIVASGSATPPPVDGYLLLTPALWSRDYMNGPMRGGLWLVARTIPALSVSGGVGGIVASDNTEALRRLGRDPLAIRETRVDSAVGLVDLMDAAVAALPACCRRADGTRAPTLLLIGDKDMIVPTHASRRAMRRVAPDAPVRIGVYPEGYHLLLAGGNRDDVVRDVVSFVTVPTAPLPSGADTEARRWLVRPVP